MSSFLFLFLPSQHQSSDQGLEGGGTKREVARNEKADVTQLGSEGGGEVGCHSKMDIDNGKS